MKIVSSQKRIASSGMSLLEILVVVAIFAILGIVTTRSVILTLKGSRRSESTLKVRENLTYSMGVVERQLRNANSITTCPNPADTTRVDYVDELGNTTSFSCNQIGSDGYIASDSARLTSTEVEITQCSFICDLGGSTNTPVVNVTFVGKDSDAVGIDTPLMTTSSKIYLRTY